MQGHRYNNKQQTITTVTGLTYTVAGLSASTGIYTFTVKAKDAAGNVSARQRKRNYAIPAPDATVLLLQQV
jgi:hypothetical protein